MDQAAALKSLETRVEEACTTHELAHSNDRNYRACVSLETDYFVKFGHPDAIWPEFQTQRYIFEYTRSNPYHDTPRIPQPIHCFGGSMTAYLVMEFISLTVHPPDLIERAARALACLSTVPPPAGHSIGPLGGGRIRHRFFKDNVAPLPFPDVEALERYMGKAYTLLSAPARKKYSPVVISGDRLMFAQSDMHPSNFGVDQDGKTVLLDFAEIGLLPATFVAHTISSDKNLAPIATALKLPTGSNASMAAISSLLWSVGAPKLGLDKHGYPKAGVNSRGSK
ncbi:hypothetical protein BDV93DRAFT_536333 [Ceratobasidium sp. AG-I]|nr:hypothetical protein BDV93DRAFT_536333 [Ceratobasidium sp. AG-I]